MPEPAVRTVVGEDADVTMPGDAELGVGFQG